MRKEKNASSDFKEDTIYKFISNIILVLLSICCLYPFLIIVGSSFEAQAQLIKTGFTVWPQKFSLEAYKLIFTMSGKMLDAYKITIITSAIITISGLYLESLFGYVISRRDYQYRKGLSFFIFFTMLFNGGLVPSYILISNWLNLKDSLLALILPGLAGAWHILIFKTFFMSIPSSLIEAAKIDGAKEYTIFTRIIIPLSKPAFACIGLFILLTAWNDWYLSLLYIKTSSKVKLQYLLMSIMKNVEYLNSAEATQYGVNEGMMTIPTINTRMAMCVLVVTPILTIFPFFQKYFVRGLTVGSVKG